MVPTFLGIKNPFSRWNLAVSYGLIAHNMFTKKYADSRSLHSKSSFLHDGTHRHTSIFTFSIKCVLKISIALPLEAKEL
jgi:hypothetical protein